MVQEDLAETYGADFFSGVEHTAEGSAERVLPMILELLRPRSVIDVGCGLGTWLAAVAKLGIEDYLGVDGYAPTESLRIPAERFVRRDLSAPLRLDRRFDLVLSLEVAEHLPPEAAGVLVESLAQLGPAVLFSAAVPHQSGEHHLNEQWPDYWIERFARHGLVALDVLRPRMWQDDGVAWWYRQNMLLFCEEGLVDREPALKAARHATRERQLSVVHPNLFAWMVHQRDRAVEDAARPLSVRESLAMLRRAVAGAARRRLG